LRADDVVYPEALNVFYSLNTVTLKRDTFILFRDHLSDAALALVENLKVEIR